MMHLEDVDSSSNTFNKWDEKFGSAMKYNH